MKVGVWDTYVTNKNGSIMHFDIIVPEEVNELTTIFNYGREYLKLKGQEGQPISSKECQFCHFQNSKSLWENDLLDQGYYIFEMENCE
jgi:hypothetical protein